MDYQQPEMYNETPGQDGKGMAIASLVLGIVALAIGWCCCIGLICGILAIVFSCISKKRDGRFSGMALAGLILGCAGIVGYIAGVAFSFATMDFDALMNEMGSV